MCVLEKLRLHSQVIPIVSDLVESMHAREGALSSAAQMKRLIKLIPNPGVSVARKLHEMAAVRDMTEGLAAGEYNKVATLLSWTKENQSSAVIGATEPEAREGQQRMVTRAVLDILRVDEDAKSQETSKRAAAVVSLKALLGCLLDEEKLVLLDKPFREDGMLENH